CARRRGARLARQRGVRCGKMSFALKRVLNGPRAFGRRFAFRRRAVPSGVGPLRALARPLRSLALLWRFQIDAGPTCFGKPNCDGLLCRASPMFSLANMVNLLAHKLACLGAGRFSFPLVLLRACDGFLFWHGFALSVM